MEKIKWISRRAKLNEIIPHEKNPRRITVSGKDELRESIKKFGLAEPLVVNADGKLIGGHARLEVLIEEGVKEEQIFQADRQLTDEEVKELLVRLNKNIAGEWDWELLEQFYEPDALFDWGFTEKELKETFEWRHSKIKEAKEVLKERFIVPPFSVLDMKQGYWQERKNAWKTLIGDMGESREKAIYKGGKNYVSNRLLAKSAASGASLLDPVLAEILLYWFCPEGAKVIDPFAGDTIFGYVAGKTGYEFTGIELRKEQATLNQARCDKENLPVKYICDDGRNINKHIADNSIDFMFSCPPYYDLEKYSKDPRDAANQKNYDDFLALMKEVIQKGSVVLRDNRFAAFVLGDIRDKGNGFYRNMVRDISEIFEECGMRLYNEMVLLEMPGTSGLKVNGAMKTRKIIKTHQNVVVFYKGDPKYIKTDFPQIHYESTDVDTQSDSERNEPYAFEEAI